MAMQRLQVIVFCCLFAGLAQRTAAQNVNEIGFEQTAYTVLESDGDVMIRVRLTDINDAQTNDDTLGVLIMGSASTSDGSAVGSNTANVGDYMIITNDLVTYTVGSALNSRQNIMDIPINDDAIVEGTESFTVTLSAVSGLGNPQIDPLLSVATVFIIDNDVQISLEQNTYTGSEDSGLTEEICAIVSAGQGNIVGTIFATITPVQLAVTNAATATNDYNPSPFTITLSASQTRTCIQVPIVDDVIADDNEVFQVSLSTNQFATSVVGIATATVTINDNDQEVDAGFQLLSYNVNEDAGTVQACVSIVSPVVSSLSALSTVTVSFQDNSATSGGVDADYIAIASPSSILTFPAGSSVTNNPFTTSSQCFTVSIVNDNLLDPNENFFLSIVGTTGLAVIDSNRNQATVNIIDNDIGATIGFQNLVFTEDEGVTFQACAIIISTTNNQPLSTAVTANVATSSTGATATAGLDYSTVLTPSILTFGAGSIIGNTACFDVSLLTDSVVEGQEFFFLSLTSSDGLVTISSGQSSATVNIVDISSTFNIALVDNSVPESVGNAVVLITPQGPVSEQVILTISTNSGSATGGGVDFNDVFATLTFAAGATNAQTVSIGIIDDLIVEADETFTVIASSGNIRVILIGSPATVTIEDNDVLTIGLVPPAGGVGVPNYQIPENSGPIEICVEVLVGSLAPGQTATVLFSTSDGSALQPADYTMTTMTLQFNVANINNMLCVDVPIQNDLLCEGNEIFNVFLTENDPNAVLGQASGIVTIIDDDTASVALNFVEPPMSGGSVTECMDEELCFRLDLATAVTKGPGRQCVITVQTADGSAVAGQDYTALSDTCVFTATTTFCDFCIGIEDNMEAELDEYFSILLNSNDLSACQIQDDNITATIVDDEDCDDDPCGDFEVCQELPCPNNFTCIPEGVGDDPHFAVTMADGKTLCYTVQGEHGFAFNLISNKKVYMNAMFVPDAHREEVTWLGTMGIVINNNGYKKSNMTRLRFEAIKNRIHIDDQMVLEARNIEKITFQNGKMTISEAPPTEGYKQPFVRVDLKDVDISFSIKFMTEHLDLYWHSTGQKVADSHGLIGQFFRDGVSLDNIRKLLILPGKEPVPIQRKPLWAFMERERGDLTNFCWVAMNPGYQGEGLIDGSYFDYLVDDVLSTEFKYKKL